PIGFSADKSTLPPARIFAIGSLDFDRAVCLVENRLAESAIALFASTCGDRGGFRGLLRSMIRDRLAAGTYFPAITAWTGVEYLSTRHRLPSRLDGTYAVPISQNAANSMALSY